MGMYVTYWPWPGFEAEVTKFGGPLNTSNGTVPVSLSEWLVPGTWIDED